MSADIEMNNIARLRVTAHRPAHYGGCFLQLSTVQNLITGDRVDSDCGIGFIIQPHVMVCRNMRMVLRRIGDIHRHIDMWAGDNIGRRHRNMEAHFITAKIFHHTSIGLSVDRHYQRIARMHFAGNRAADQRMALHLLIAVKCVIRRYRINLDCCVDTRINNHRRFGIRFRHVARRIGGADGGG